VEKLRSSNGLWYLDDRIAVPNVPALRLKILRELHDAPTAGHMGVDRTFEAVSRRFWWPDIRSDVTDYVSRCHSCQINKPSNRRKAGLLMPLSVPSYAFEHVTTDLITDLPVTETGHDSIAVFVDRLTKTVHFAATTKTVNASEYARLLTDTVVRAHGVPKVIISDRDPRFTSQFWREFAKLCGTELRFSTAYHPQTDGQSERTNRTLEQVLRAYVLPNQSDWDKHLSMAEFAMNNSVSASTGNTPFYALYARHPLAPIDMALSSDRVPAAVNLRNAIDAVVQDVERNLADAQRKQAEYANQSRRELTFKTGDKVLLNTVNLKLPSTMSSKLKQRWIGPFAVTKVISPVAYTLQLPKTMKAHHPTFHVSLLKPYNTPVVPVDTPGPIFEDDNQWRVETLIRKRASKGKTQYLVRWLGFGPEDDTWEYATNIEKSLITDFKRSQRTRPGSSA